MSSPLSAMTTFLLGVPLPLPIASTFITTSMPSRTDRSVCVCGGGGCVCVGGAQEETRRHASATARQCQLTNPVTTTPMPSSTQGGVQYLCDCTGGRGWERRANNGRGGAHICKREVSRAWQEGSHTHMHHACLNTTSSPTRILTPLPNTTWRPSSQAGIRPWARTTLNPGP